MTVEKRGKEREEEADPEVRAFLPPPPSFATIHARLHCHTDCGKFLALFELSWNERGERGGHLRNMLPCLPKAKKSSKLTRAKLSEKQVHSRIRWQHLAPVAESHEDASARGGSPKRQCKLQGIKAQQREGRLNSTTTQNTHYVRYSAERGMLGCVRRVLAAGASSRNLFFTLELNPSLHAVQHKVEWRGENEARQESDSIPAP